MRLGIPSIGDSIVQAFSFLDYFRMAVRDEDDRHDKGRSKNYGYIRQVRRTRRRSRLVSGPVVGSTDSGWREAGCVRAS